MDPNLGNRPPHPTPPAAGLEARGPVCQDSEPHLGLVVVLHGHGDDVDADDEGDEEVQVVAGAQSVDGAAGGRVVCIVGPALGLCGESAAVSGWVGRDERAASQGLGSQGARGGPRLPRGPRGRSPTDLLLQEGLSLRAGPWSGRRS